MDKTVPTGAALLLDFIRQTEVGRKDRASYDVIFANKQGRLAKPLTSMTLDEVLAAQKGWSKNNGSSAAGGYQFMRATLVELIAELALRGSQLLDTDLQDRLGFHLLKRRGYQQYVDGTINAVEFAKRLAMEWASFPVLVDCMGAHRKLKRGQSYYAGDGLNKALVSPEKIEALLLLVRKAPDPAPAPQPTVQPAPAPVPAPEPRKGFWQVLVEVLTKIIERVWK